MNAVREFVDKHAVRIAAILAALVPLLVSQWPAIPWEMVAATVAGVLGIGESVQRREDAKTLEALLRPAPEQEAAGTDESP